MPGNGCCGTADRRTWSANPAQQRRPVRQTRRGAGPVPSRRGDGALHVERLCPDWRSRSSHIAAWWGSDDNVDRRGPQGLPHHLVGRLWPNVETEEQIKMRATDAEPGDDPGLVFPWLVPTRGSNPKAHGRSTTPADVHPLQVYWGMPRRLRLLFEDARERPCGLTGVTDSVIVKSYRSKNYGTDYSEGFEHPLTPYYRQKAGAAKLPVHPQARRCQLPALAGHRRSK